MLEQIDHGAVRELRMSRPPVNALNPELIAELRTAVLAAQADPSVGSIVISGRAGLFSAGLDVPALMTLDRASLRTVWVDFFGLLEALARSPKLSVAAITGHSPAGGAVMAMYCDYRVMAEGNFRIGLNEVQVGLAVPEVLCRTLARLLGEHRAERLLVAGALIDASEALRIGFVDELCAVDQVPTRAIEWCQQMLAMPQRAQSLTRQQARAGLCAWFDQPEQLDIDGFVDGWFSDESQQVLRALVASMKRS